MLKSLRLCREQIAAHFWAAGFVFALFFGAGAAAALAYPDEALDIISIIGQKFADKGLLTAEPYIAAWLIFCNNLTVCALLLLLGFVPFLFLPCAIIAMNGLAAGVIITAVPMPAESSRLLSAAAGLLPHGIFELPALFIAAALGTLCCARLTGAILDKLSRKISVGNKAPANPKQTVLLMARIFLLIVVPLLFIAAAAEVWVTPLAQRALL